MENVKTGHKNPIVCLDAGHCGKQNRSPVVPGFYESEVNWKLYNLLAQKLKDYGITVISTRSGIDTDMELTARGKKAKDCDLFISLHVNAADDSNVNYVLGVYMVDDGCGEIDRQSQQVAKLLSNSVAEIMDTKTETWTRHSSADRDGNGYKDDYYGVLRGAHSVGTAGVIVEHGFYTNKAQAEFLLLDSNLEKISEAEAEAIAGYFHIETKAHKMVTVKLPVLKPGDSCDAVRTMQLLLESHGYKLKKGATGNFGSGTEAALLQFKKDNGLKMSELCGQQTWAALLRVCQ